jgi:hypothetical protein
VKDASLRPRVVNDCAALIDAEVGATSGISGFAIKAGYKVVKSLKGGRMVPDLVDGLLNEFADAIEPLHGEYRSAGAKSGGFAGFLKANERRAVQALLSVTDGRARRTDNQMLKKTYDGLRKYAEDSVARALPGVGAMVDRHCA